MPTTLMAVRLRLVATCMTAAGMVLVIVMVGALFPAVGGSIGQLSLPDGVSELLGGADYGSITGWMRSEIGAVYGPLVIGGTAIAAAAGSLAGEEESGILGLIVAYPVDRSRIVLEKAVAVAVEVLFVALGTWLGLVVGVALAGGGIGLGEITALAVHLAMFGVTVGALSLALAALTGRRAVAIGGAAAFAVLSFLINGFAPVVDGIEWLRYLSLFHYYSGHDPLGSGVDLGGLAILAAVSLALLATAAVSIRRRDLRA